MVAAVAVTGCLAPVAPSPPSVPVSIYGRNAAISDAWFAVQPVGDTLFSVGFGRDAGVGCWMVPAGSEIVMLDHSPSLGPTNVVRAIATVVDRPNSDRQKLWVDVAADGSLSTGSGVAPWWPPGGGGC